MWEHFLAASGKSSFILRKTVKDSVISQRMLLCLNEMLRGVVTMTMKGSWPWNRYNWWKAIKQTNAENQVPWVISAMEFRGHVEVLYLDLMLLDWAFFLLTELDIHYVLFVLKDTITNTITSLYMVQLSMLLCPVKYKLSFSFSEIKTCYYQGKDTFG